MTLTQRLTRAGATFIILGTAAVLVPQNGEAKATTSSGNCSTQTPFYKLTTSPDFSDTSGATTAVGAAVTVYAASSTNGTDYTAAGSTFSYTGGGTNLSNASGTSTTISTPAAGSYTLTGMYSGISLTYPVQVNGK